ncbi:DUF3710 domain-containing protein [Pseudonocardia asaccharolytica]|uniref:DUF3710 domain-containing protein n=1 Tax=Pseudonocardia asaccharolytica DSM 44247 = NBRC 16224 TaxID=1123024 RepID=A0A511CZR7_9PSEU|nr:DUF3710 domain-containing protein [Pseudonocardia asaccharolytica]GEL18036.1 hypothetical protein PA7_18730 [Pseudonocardia asaccharolytica DSM 44247 = NBRC 16224]
MAARNRGSLDELGSIGVGPGPVAVDEETERPPFGPFDISDLDPETDDPAARLDFGALQVPLPDRGTVSVEPTANGRLQAVHVALPEGRLSVSALAAPRSSRLWPELAKEIETSLRDGGAQVRSFQGDWGRELRAHTQGASSVFVGVDGSRWMLYGVATGPVQHAVDLDAELRRMLHGTVVVRGRSPYPPRTVLPLELPAHLKEQQAAAEAAAAEAAAAEAAVPGPDLETTSPLPRLTAAPRAGRRRRRAVGPGVVPFRPPAGARPGGRRRAPDPELATTQTQMFPALSRPAGPDPVANPVLGTVSDPDTDSVPTGPLPVLTPPTAASTPAPAPTRHGRHSRPDDEEESPAAPAPRPGPGGLPALAYLADDPTVRFAALERASGRHHRPGHGHN